MNTLSVKESLRHGWNTFKSRPWIFVQVGILLFLLNIAMNLVQSVLEYGGQQGGDMVALALGLLSLALGIGVSFLISMGETAFFLRAHDETANLSFKDLWHPHPFWKFLGASLLAGLMILVGLVLLIVPGIIVGLMVAFVGYIVIDEKLGPIDAIKRSIALTKGSRVKLFQLALATLLLNILGFLALLVGLFVTIPVSFIAMVHAYRTLKGQGVAEAVVEPVAA
ncbi:MAG: hypothetical protein V4682_02220 [Patescibacteria group bacterium]